MRETGERLPAMIAVHRDLILPSEEDGTREICGSVVAEATKPGFWSVDAGAFLSSISGDLNDALWPEPADEAGVFNVFQLVTSILADRARHDDAFRRMIQEPQHVDGEPIPEFGSITRKLGVAINDHDAGRISRGHLTAILQAAIDNGDILEDDNQEYVVAVVYPLVNAGLLRPSEHLRAFEDRMKSLAAEFLAERRAGGHRQSRGRWWWPFKK
jgi:hypothetical protein